MVIAIAIAIALVVAIAMVIIVIARIGATVSALTIRAATVRASAVGASSVRDGGICSGVLAGAGACVHGRIGQGRGHIVMGTGVAIGAAGCDRAQREKHEREGGQVLVHVAS